jgi:hypothetical protein
MMRLIAIELWTERDVRIDIAYKNQISEPEKSDSY